MGGLSHFSGGNSTAWDLIWITLWLVLGLLLGPITAYMLQHLEHYDEAGIMDRLTLGMVLVGRVCYTIPAFIGFVSVGQMIKEYGVCSTIG